MKPQEVIRRLEDHFAIHNDGRPTPYLDEAVRMAIEALKRQMWIPANVLPEAEDEHGNSKDVLVVRQRYFKGKPVEGEVFMDIDYYNHELALWMGAPDPIIAWMPLPIYTD